MALLRSRKLALLFIADLLITALVYAWCLTQGSCTGECIAVGYSVGKTCIYTALKVFVGLAFAIFFVMISQKIDK